MHAEGGTRGQPAAMLHSHGGSMAASPGNVKSTHSGLRPSDAKNATSPSGLTTVVASLRSGWKSSFEQLCAARQPLRRRPRWHSLSSGRTLKRSSSSKRTL